MAEGANSMYDELTMDKPREECGLFGIYGKNIDIARLTYYGIYALQHRGQESAGICVSDGENFSIQKNMGLVQEVFEEEDLHKLQGHIAIGHVRYSTTGSSLIANAQPLTFRYLKGQIALAHNGNLTNAGSLGQQLAMNGSVFQTTTDSEVVINLIARYSQDAIEDALMKAMIDIKGAYSILLMTEKELIGVRDPYGVRPLCIGKLGDAFILASETCALDTVGAEFVRDVAPGEIIIIDENGLRSINAFRAPKQAFCVFEFVYLARPDSNFSGKNVSVARREMGRQLARETKIEADLVIAVPDSGTAAAYGYALESGIPFAEGLMKNRYIGRTFIQPNQKMRDTAVRLKLNPIREVLEGKRVIMVDDSIVRGTTSQKIVNMLRQAGAKEVHMLVSSPPIKHSCYYGIDTSERNELVAVKYSLEEIKNYINADSLHYLSHEGMLQAINASTADSFCGACFTGNYPIEIEKGGKFALEGGTGCGC